MDTEGEGGGDNREGGHFLLWHIMKCNNYSREGWRGYRGGEWGRAGEMSGKRGEKKGR